MAFRHELEDFARFYERSYPGAFRTALAIVGEAGLADDVVQDAFVAAFRERDRFRGEAPAGAWLHRIVVNAALTGLRRRRGVREIPVGGASEATGPAASTAPSAIADRDAILTALGVLAPRSRAAIVLRYYHDLDHATIAGIIGTSPGNVGVLLSRALDRLRPALEAPLSAPTTAAPDRRTEVGDVR